MKTQLLGCLLVQESAVSKVTRVHGAQWASWIGDGSGRFASFVTADSSTATAPSRAAPEHYAREASQATDRRRGACASDPRGGE